MTAARCSETNCRTKAVVKEPNEPAVIHHTADCRWNIKNRGEYVVEVRKGECWDPSLDFDPLVDWDDQFTENALHELRIAVARLNKDGYAYRVRYVPPDGPRVLGGRLGRV